jgi:hypothetical protein
MSRLSRERGALIGWRVPALWLLMAIAGCAAAMGGKATVALRSKVATMPAGTNQQFVVDSQHCGDVNWILSPDTAHGGGLLAMPAAQPFVTAHYIAPPTPPRDDQGAVVPVTVTVRCGEASDFDTITITPAPGPVVTITPPSFSASPGGSPVELTIAVTQDDPADTLSGAVAGNDGHLGPFSGAPGSGAYTVQYFPAPQAAAAHQVTINVASSLPNSTTGSAFANVTPGLAVPWPPIGVVAAPGDAQVTISWAAEGGATSYVLYWSTTSGLSKASGTRIAGATSPEVLTGLANGTTYYFVVTAVNSAGESSESAEVSATPDASLAPVTPSDVVATPGIGTVTLTFGLSPNATSFNVYWSTTQGAGLAGTKISHVPMPFVHSALTNGVTYYYVVTAVGPTGESLPSDEVSATPYAAPYIAAVVLTVEGGVASPFRAEQVWVCGDSACRAPLGNATVTVNGGNHLWFDYGYFSGNQVIPAGAAVDVQVAIDRNVYSVTGTQFSSAPTVTAPTAGAVWQVADQNSVTWTGGAPVTGAAYGFGLAQGNVFLYPVPQGWFEDLSLATTTESIPANVLYRTVYQVWVGIGTSGFSDLASGGIPVPGAATGSGLWLGLFAPPVSVSVE